MSRASVQQVGDGACVTARCPALRETVEPTADDCIREHDMLLENEQARAFQIGRRHG